LAVSWKSARLPVPSFFQSSAESQQPSGRNIFSAKGLPQALKLGEARFFSPAKGLPKPMEILKKHKRLSEK
jgi:hypothetical protein